MQTFEELRAESKKLEQYIKRERYKNNKNEVENAIKTNNITLEDVKHMTTKQINDNWETIKKLNFNNR
ncbi:MAG: hypothetical protein J6D47_17930 [Peptostreptococcaceae bacterium]|jgi:hypothetical protein|nr:hypothetical protein [Peptostreptococcaceae bacterium]